MTQCLTLLFTGIADLSAYSSIFARGVVEYPPGLGRPVAASTLEPLLIVSLYCVDSLLFIVTLFTLLTIPPISTAVDFHF